MQEVQDCAQLQLLLYWQAAHCFDELLRLARRHGHCRPVHVFSGEEEQEARPGKVSGFFMCSEIKLRLLVLQCYNVQLNYLGMNPP